MANTSKNTPSYGMDRGGRKDGHKNQFNFLCDSKIHNDNHDFDENSIENHIDYKIDKKILYINDVSKVSINYLINAIIYLILHNSIESINIKGLKTSDEKRKINTILLMNYPLLEIKRLNKGDTIHNFVFFGIKTLNDKYGHCFVDEIISVIKTYLINMFDQFFANTSIKGRLLRENYRNVSFGVPKPVAKRFDVFKQLNQKELKRVIVEFLDDYITQYAELNCFYKQEIINDIIKHFNFKHSFSQEIPDDTDQSKLMAFYQAEIASRDSNNENMGYSFERTIEIVNQIREIKEEINNNEGKQFKVGPYSFPILCRIMNSDLIITPDLYKAARKGQEIRPKRLGDLMKKMLELFNMGFDFISPLIFPQDWEVVEKINKQYQSGKISSEYFLDDYKGFRTKSGFYQEIQQKDGMCIFIDIKDMGLLNIFSFERIYKHMLIPGSSKEKLLTAGRDVTYRLQELMKMIKRKYPNAILSRGGDEIRIFIPNMKKILSNGVIKTISSNISECGFDGRMVFSFGTVKNASDLFDKLERYTRINKSFEEQFKLYLYNKGIGHRLPKYISLTIDNQLQEYTTHLSLFWEVIDFDLNRIEEFIKNRKILNKIITKKVILNQNGKQVEIILRFVFSKDERGNITIKIDNI